MRGLTSELTTRLGGELVGPDVSVEGASIDSRTIRPGQLYVPIVAERDGHAFIGAALESGAAAYLTAQQPVGGTAIRVRDTAAALLSLGALARDRVGGAIGITGSVGKTTTKDLVAACLAPTFRTAASERSFNNELGLPLTLLNAPETARWVVLEMGVRRVGDIERLAEVARPDVGVVTSVDMAHLEFLGDLDGVARAKGELVAALPASGVAVLNFDDPRVREMAPLGECPALGYAVGADADVRADDVTLDRDLRARFRLSSPWGRTEVRLALHGAQQIPNALAAATVALWCGVPLDAVAEALGTSHGSPWRMEVRHVPGGPVLVVDCFNAIPASAEAAVRSLAALTGGRKLALLGLMAELGDRSEPEHRRIAALADELGVDVVGYETPLYGDSYVTGVDEAAAVLRTLGPGDAALVKGSRVTRLEDVVRAYTAGAADDDLGISPAYRKPDTRRQQRAVLTAGMTYSSPAETTTAQLAETVADEGWSVVGTLDGPLSRRLLRAVDEVAARSPDTAGQVHQLSGLAQHPDLAEVVDWRPLLALAVELLSPNVYINHSHLDVHPPHPPTGAHRWHRDNGLMGRDMRLLWRDQPRVTLKVAIYLTDVESPDDGALEVVPRSHLDTASRYPTEEQPEGVPILGPAGTVAVFDARLWHRRRDNLGARVRRAMFWAYSYRWLTSRDTPFEDVPEWAGLSPIRRQLLGDKTVDPFYWASGELALDPRSAGLREAA